MNLDHRNYDSNRFIDFLALLTIRGFERYYENRHVLSKDGGWVEISPVSYGSITAISLIWLYVPSYLRGTGRARQVLKDLTEIADKVDVDLLAAARPFKLKFGIDTYLTMGMPENHLVLLDGEDFKAWENVLFRFGFHPDPMIPVTDESVLLGRMGLIRYPQSDSKDFQQIKSVA